MDGDHTAKTFEQGANSALKDQEMTSGIHESVNQVVSRGLVILVKGKLGLHSISRLLVTRLQVRGQACFPKMGQLAPCSMVRVCYFELFAEYS